MTKAELIAALEMLLPEGRLLEYEEGYADAIVAALSLAERLEE